jgi:mono/diheme cytochrome c family protein
MKGEGGKGSPLDSTGHAWHHPDGQLYDFIHNGKWGPVENMPPFKDTLNAKEIDEIIVFIKTFWDEEQREMQADMSSRYQAPKQGK